MKQLSSIYVVVDSETGTPIIPVDYPAFKSQFYAGMYCADLNRIAKNKYCKVVEFAVVEVKETPDANQDN